MMKKFRRKEKGGLSPVITTVLLIALVVVSVSIIFLWFRGMVEEGVTKFGKNIELVCDDVAFDADYDSSGKLNIVNTGNVPIYKINLKMSSGGNFETKELDAGILQGGVYSESVSIGDADTLTVFPILAGTSSSGQKTYICGGEYGKELSV